MKTLGVLFILLAMNVSAADITGKWKAALKTENGTISRTFVFKQDDTRLTGKTTSDRWGTSTLRDGKIEGDTLSFTVTVDIGFGSVKIAITGKVQGDVIQMTAEVGGKTLEFAAKRTP